MVLLFLVMDSVTCVGSEHEREGGHIVECVQGNWNPELPLCSSVDLGPVPTPEHMAVPMEEA